MEIAIGIGLSLLLFILEVVSDVLVIVYSYNSYKEKLIKK